MSETLIVSLASWIIQDGNYPDLASGQAFACALEYYNSDPFQIARPNVAVRPSHTRSRDLDYAVTGKTVYSAEDWHAIDVGILAFRNFQKAPLGGEAFTGHVVFGVDPYFYFESNANELGVPALIYDWTIRKIEMNTSPWITEDRVKRRDPAKPGWAEVAQTNAWSDDGGSGDYRLYLELGDAAPRHRLEP